MKGTENAYEGENRSLHMKERIGYGVGDFANKMMYTPVNSFFTYFLTNVAGLGAGVVGTILLVSRLLDGVSDLIVGSLMEKIHSKHGKARPWLLWWCIPFAVSLVLMFTAPDFGTTGKIIYAFLTYNLAVTVVYTAINLPFGSLAALMTKNQTERGYLNISKMVFAFGGGMVVNAATLPLVKYFGNDSSAWQKTFLIYGVVAIIFFLIVFFTTKEAVTEEAKKAGSEEKVNIPQALKSLIKNKYWMILLAIFFLNSVVNAFIGVNVYYAQYIMNDDSLVGNLSIFQNIASFAAFAVCTGIIRKIGKQKIAISGVAISFIGYAMVLLNPIAIGSIFIGNMPHRKCWMMGVTHSHLLCNCSCSLSIFQAVYAEEHAHSMGSFSSCNINRKYFWISGGQPGRLCSSWSCKAHMNTVFPNFINDSVQPFEIINTLVWLKLCP